MDRPAVYRSSLPQPWSQPHPYSAPPNPGHPRPLVAQYPPPDTHNVYTAPALYPNVVSQQFPRGYPQPSLPNILTPGGGRPRTRSAIGGNGPLFETPPPIPQFPSFPSPSPVRFPQPPPFPPIPLPPSKPPALRSQLSGYPFPVTHPTRGEVPIRPAPMSARRSSSSPALNRISSSDPPPPIPPLPPNYQSSYPQHPPQHVSPAAPPRPPPIPIPSPGQPYRSDSSPLYPSPFETSASPFFISPPPRAPSPPRIPTSPSPKFESDAEHAPINEEEALAFAIALSEWESKEHSGKISQEEEELAKAIEESMRHTSSFGMPVPYTDAGPSRIPTTTSPPLFPTPLPVSESPISASPRTSHLSVSRPPSKVSSPLIHPVQPSIDDDEALAQQLADEEERAAAGPSNPRPEPPSALPHTKSEITTTPAPVPTPSPTSWRRHDIHRQRFPMVDSEPLPPLYHHAISSAQTPFPTQTSSVSPNNSPSLGRSSSASAVMPSSSRLSPIPGKDEKPNGGRSQSLDAVPVSSSSSSGSNSLLPIKPCSLSTVEESFDSPSAQSPTSPSDPATSSPPTANSFIDQQLLNGVSLGFNAPQISSIRTTLKGGVPHTISLHGGRFLPFHIQAPDWRHLLKMMARLSGSRIEASIEAMAGTKQELKLRTVVQFVRVNTTSQDWRTVIYLTIDNPPPSNAPHKYTNGDVNTLPFSYTGSPLPALLRDGSDTPMSKYYTIPATTNTPYPTLPISFPNMAMYLASAVEDSRRMGHDNSSGMKRLAKTLDSLYPAEVELGMEDDEPNKPPGGMMNMFKNVFGRGRRDQRRNDDNYADLVTPFVPEWG